MISIITHLILQVFSGSVRPIFKSESFVLYKILPIHHCTNKMSHLLTLVNKSHTTLEHAIKPNSQTGNAPAVDIQYLTVFLLSLIVIVYLCYCTAEEIITNDADNHYFH